MKQRTLLILVSTAMILPVLSSCGTSKIVFDIINPAEVRLPGGVENSTLVNLVSSSFQDNLEGVADMLKGKGELVNQFAAQSSIDGLRRELQSITRAVPLQTQVTEELILYSSGQPDLSWAVLDSICKSVEKETVIALKSLESRTAMDYSGYERKAEKDPLKVWSIDFAYNVSTDWVYLARLKVYVNIGWKIYHPAERNILLDRVYYDSLFTEASGLSKSEAERGLPGIKNAIEEAAFIAGSRFASQVSPQRNAVERKYFTSGNNDFRQANNFVEMRYWDRAAEYWQKNSENPNPKIAGRALYNLALTREMNGELAEAIDLVDNALVLYQHKLIEAYFDILKQRRKAEESNPYIP